MGKPIEITHNLTVGTLKVTKIRMTLVRTTLKRSVARGRTEYLNRSRYVQHARNMGWPVWREPYGHGAFVVVRERESRLHGKGRQVLLS